jgi:hypothetical protein
MKFRHRSSLFLLLLTLSMAFAAPLGALAYNSVDPPIAAVQTADIALLSRMTGGAIPSSPGFDGCSVESAGELMTAGRVISSGSAFVKFFGLFPAVDDRISAEYPPSAYWAFGQDLSIYRWSTTNCDYTAYPSISWNHVLAATFHNTTSTYQNPSSRPSSLPARTLADLGYANGIERLNASIASTLTVSYRVVQCCVGSPNCNENEETVRIRCNEAKDYAVEGVSVSRLRVSPPVKEQWYQDNRFENAVVAQRTFYKGTAYVNGQQFASFKIHNFSVYQDPHGFQRIYSTNINQNQNMTISELISNQTHDWVLESGAFSTYYQLNSSYEGLGWNNLTIEIVDFFGRTFNYTDEIHSRKLSYNENLSEDTQPTAKEDLRPSKGWDGGDYKLMEIVASGSFVGLLVAIFMLKRRG